MHYHQQQRSVAGLDESDFQPDVETDNSETTIRESASVPQALRDLATTFGLRHQNKWFKAKAEQITGKTVHSAQIINTLGREKDRMAISATKADNAARKFVKECCDDISTAIAYLEIHKDRLAS